MTDSPSPKPEGDARVQKLPSPPLKIPYEDLPRRTFGYDRAATAQLFAEVAKSYERLGAERSSLEERIGRLEADLADERAKQANASGSTRELKAELEQARRHGEELKAELEQAREQGQQLEAELERFREREAESGSRLERSEAELSRFRERERSLAEALILARQTASELLERTEREAEELVAGAKQKAAEIVSGAERELDRLTARREQLDALTSEVQEDLSTFLLGTLERLKAQPTEPSPAPAAAADEPNGDETPAGDGTAAKAPRADTRAKPRARPASS